MIITGLFFLALICLGYASIYAAIRMILAHHIVRSSMIVIVVFVVAAALEATLLFGLHSQVASRREYWNMKRQTNSDELIYVALGDSAAQGIGASSTNKSYVGLLAAEMESHTGRRVRVINLSRSGAKLHDLIYTQLPELHGINPDIVTVDIGANDIVGNTAHNVMVREYEQAINILSPYPVVFGNLPDFMWGKQLRNTIVLNKTIKEQCAEHKLYLADLQRVTHQKMWSLNEFAADGFHPNDNGHRTWAAAFIPSVEKLLVQRTNK